MAMLFTVLCGMAALSLGYFINYFTTGHFVHSTEAALDAQSKLIEAIGIPKDGQQGKYLYRALSQQGTWPQDIQVTENVAEGVIILTLPDHDNKRYAARIYTFENQHKLLIGFDITQILHDFKFMQIMGICSIIFVMMVVFASYIISLFVVNGTNTIAQTARDIIRTGDLSQRLEVSSRWDDLSNMAAVLNTLLDRIEELMTGVRRVSDNIAHDLRTPLTRMRSHIEELQKKHKYDYTPLLEEADHLLNTFTALLRITRLETEKQRSHFTALNLQQLIIDAAAFYEPLAEEKNIRIQIETVIANVVGDKNLLFQAYANMIDNAIKFTPDGGEIKIELTSNAEETRIIIEDNGRGVDETEREKIFDRFYRTDKSRTFSGAGLGLSLVRAVIELHKGDIKVEDAMPGLRIITIL